jgi:pyruvate kinase
MLLLLSTQGFIADVAEGDTLLVDGGLLSFRVAAVRGRDVVCRCIDGGELASRRHLNVRGKSASLPSITQKDWEDIAFGVQHGVDFFALSFVNSAEVVLTLKAYLAEKKSHARVIAKIESAASVTNLSEILAAADGAMVARGDLGAEMPVEVRPLLLRPRRKEQRLDIGDATGGSDAARGDHPAVP